MHEDANRALLRLRLPLLDALKTRSPTPLDLDIYIQPLCAACSRFRRLYPFFCRAALQVLLCCVVRRKAPGSLRFDSLITRSAPPSPDQSPDLDATMPWRNSDAYGSQQYAAFTDPNGFNFAFDVGSDNLMSPYAFPHMSPDSAC